MALAIRRIRTNGFAIFPNPDTWLGAARLALRSSSSRHGWSGRAVRLAIHRYLDKPQRAGADPTGIRFLGQLASVGVYVFAFHVYSHIVPGFAEFGHRLADQHGIGFGGGGARGAKHSRQFDFWNFPGALSPVQDRRQLQVSCPTGVEIGTVESINLGTTVLRTADNRRLVVPNSTMASQTRINLSQPEKARSLNMTIVLAAAMDPAPARKILTDLAKAHPKTIAVDGCIVTALSGSGTTVTLKVWCADPDTAVLLKSDLLEAAKKQFDAAGIKIARSIGLREVGE